MYNKKENLPACMQVLFFIISYYTIIFVNILLVIILHYKFI